MNLLLQACKVVDKEEEQRGNKQKYQQGQIIDLNLNQKKLKKSIANFVTPVQDPPCGSVEVSNMDILASYEPINQASPNNFTHFQFLKMFHKLKAYLLEDGTTIHDCKVKMDSVIQTKTFRTHVGNSTKTYKGLYDWIGRCKTKQKRQIQRQFNPNLKRIARLSYDQCLMLISVGVSFKALTPHEIKSLTETYQRSQLQHSQHSQFQLRRRAQPQPQPQPQPLLQLQPQPQQLQQAKQLQLQQLQQAKQLQLQKLQLQRQENQIQSLERFIGSMSIKFRKLCNHHSKLVFSFNDLMNDVKKKKHTGIKRKNNETRMSSSVENPEKKTCQNIKYL